MPRNVGSHGLLRIEILKNIGVIKVKMSPPIKPSQVFLGDTREKRDFSQFSPHQIGKRIVGPCQYKK